MAALNTSTLEQFKQFSADIAPAARAVLMARVYAEMERERVNAYVLPIFQAYKFTYGEKYTEKAGELMTDPKDLYLVDDLEDPIVAAFYADCDDAHRAHGFAGVSGHCPALHAEHLLMETERALIELTAPFFGLADAHIYGEKRAKWLDLIIGAAMKAEKEAR